MAVYREARDVLDALPPGIWKNNINLDKILKSRNNYNAIFIFYPHGKCFI